MMARGSRFRFTVRRAVTLEGRHLLDDAADLRLTAGEVDRDVNLVGGDGHERVEPPCRPVRAENSSPGERAEVRLRSGPRPARAACTLWT